MARTPASEVRLLLHQLAEAYNRKAWHGPNLRGSLRGLTAEEAAWRPGAGRHNIWELVIHCAYWKYAVHRQLTGEKRGSFPAEGSNWFKRPLVMRTEAWKEDLHLLETQHRALIDAVRELDGAALRQKPNGSKYLRAFLVSGIAAHDLYHAGQIQLIKRMMRS